MLLTSPAEFGELIAARQGSEYSFFVLRNGREWVRERDTANNGGGVAFRVSSCCFVVFCVERYICKRTRQAMTHTKKHSHYSHVSHRILVFRLHPRLSSKPCPKRRIVAATHMQQKS